MIDVELHNILFQISVMINNPFIFLFLILSLVCKVSFTQKSNSGINLPNDFVSRSFNHVESISNVGIHSAGTKEEKEVAEYIFTELSNMGIETYIEKFEFQSFDIDDINLKINNRDIEVMQICFNPYTSDLHFQDDFILLDSNNTTETNIKDKIVLASFPLENTKYFRLFFERPKLILVLPATEIQLIQKGNEREFDCEVKGRIESYSSQNVIANVKGKENSNDEIILSAHYDSYPGSIGADDNASGVGVLMELAKFFKNNPSNLNLKFVAFGGEEKGLLGSRAYLDKHSKSLSHCKLLFNIDQVGGEHIFIETTGDVRGIPEKKGCSQFPAFMRNKSLEGIQSNWRLLAPEVLPLFGVSNRPEWLKNIINQSTTELSIPVSYAGNTGSDQMTFAQAGIVATAIGTSGNEVHSDKDIPTQIKKQSLENCGKIIIDIVQKTAQNE
ncbi:M28 family metallopeptidase [uncultured Draconibacterium sp.]|uniref:M28 family metallopeptidase n=1 Tax=uncultured Draconibacterium sp. TaxID=1573823 RepID=UPI0029C96F8D|nr:M28 family metallopeptidase [uncultured Draconibacterium sp.]